MLVVTAPNAADADVDAVKESISGAGARFGGQIGLTDALLTDVHHLIITCNPDGRLAFGLSRCPDLLRSARHDGVVDGDQKCSAIGLADNTACEFKATSNNRLFCQSHPRQCYGKDCVSPPFTGHVMCYDLTHLLHVKFV